MVAFAAAAVLAFLFAPCANASIEPEQDSTGIQPTVSRLASDEAAGTSLDIAKQTFSGDTKTSDWVVIARDDDFADAMSSTGLAGALNAPIILTNRTEGLDQDALDEIEALGAKYAYIIGGTGAIPADVESQLLNINVDCKGRVWGQAYYDTSVQCSKKIQEHTGEVGTDVIIAMGINFQDALSISPLAYKYHLPIFLQTEGETAADRSLTSEAISAIETIVGPKNNPKGGTIYVPGGTGALSKESVEDVFGSSRIKRMSGETGFDTSNKIAKVLTSDEGGNKLSAKTVAVANGAEKPKGTDALAGAALAGQAGGVVLLANSNPDMGEVSTTTIDKFLTDSAIDVESAFVLGGTTVMPKASSVDALKTLLWNWKKASFDKDGFTTSNSVKYLTNALEDNSNTDTAKVWSGKKLERPETPTKDGYTFGGWYKEKIANQDYEFDFDKEEVTKDITLYARWDNYNIDDKSTDITNKDGIAKPISPKTGKEQPTTVTEKDSGKLIEGATVTIDKDGNTTVILPDGYTNKDVTIHIEDDTGKAQSGQTVIVKDPDGQSRYEKDSDGNKVYKQTTGSDGNVDSLAIRYTVTFDSQGGSTVASQTVVKGEKFKQEQVPADPTLSGKVFCGWYKTSACELASVFNFNKDTVTSDITLYACWVAEQDFQVTFDSNGGSAVTSQTVKAGKCASEPATPTKKGFVFDGWYTDANLSTQFSFDTKIKSDITLYAKWAVEQDCKVTFESNGGSTVAAQTVKAGKCASKPADPTRTGYTFDKWYSNKELTQPFDFTTPITGDITVYAGWTAAITVDYKVVFNSNGGSAVETQNVKVGMCAFKPADPTKNNCEFAGWYTSATLTENYKFDFTIPIAADTTLYAKWAGVTGPEPIPVPDPIPPESPTTYYVNVADTSGAAIEGARITIDRATETDEPTFTVLLPNGATDKDVVVNITDDQKVAQAGKNVLVKDNDGEVRNQAGTKTSSAGSATVNALAYTVQFNSMGGSSVVSQTVVKSHKVEQPAAPTFAGKHFAGWFVDDAFSQEYNFNSQVTKDLTLYAKWSDVETYTVNFVTYDGDPYTPGNQTIESGKYASQPADPVHTGYTFEGWYTTNKYDTKFDFSTQAITTNTTVYAKWSANTYSITYNLDGGTNAAGNPAEYTIESANISLAAPTKAGYTFAGWFKDDGFTNKVDTINKGSTGNVVLYAKWNVVTYTITYNLNGGVDKTSNPKNYTVETDTFTLESPTREGYEFDGWRTADGTSGNWGSEVSSIIKGSTENKVLYAKWSPVQYSISYENMDGAQNNEANPSFYTVESQTINLQAPTKQYNTFDGWYSQDGTESGNWGSKVTSIAAGSMGAQTVYAKWTPETITVTFDSNGGSKVDAVTIEKGTSLGDKFPSDPTNGDSTFSCWLNLADENLGAVSKDTVFYEDVTLTAQWVKDQITITFDSNGGSSVSSIQIEKGTSLGNKLPKLQRTGYEDSYWLNGSSRVYSTTTFDSDTKLTAASWTPITYSITYNLNQGTNSSKNPSTYNVETSDIELQEPTRSGYTFEGWYKESTFVNKVETISQGSTGNVTLYAKWTETVTNLDNLIKNGQISLASNNYTYSGTAYTPAVKISGASLTQGTDYTVTYYNNKNAGTASVEVNGKSSRCQGTAVLEFTIAQKEATLTWGSTTFTYNGTTQAPTCTVSNRVSGETVNVTVAGGRVDAGSGTATASSLSNANYKLPTSNLTKAFTINKASLSSVYLQNSGTLTYNGSSQKKNVSAVYASGIEASTSDYNISGNSAVNAGTYTLTVSAKSTSTNFTGSATATWSIAKASLSSVTLNSDTKTYTGSSQTKNVSSVKAGTLTVGSSDYTVSGNTGTNAGTYTLKVTANSTSTNFTGSATAAWTINKLSIANAEVSFNSLTYNGYAQTPTLSSIKVGSVTVPTTDCTVSGTGTNAVSYNNATVTAKSSSTNFTGSKSSLTWSIDRATPTMTVSGTAYAGSGDTLSSVTDIPVTAVKGVNGATLTTGTDTNADGTLSWVNSSSTLNGGSTSGTNATQAVKFTSKNSNYTDATANATVKVFSGYSGFWMCNKNDASGTNAAEATCKTKSSYKSANRIKADAAAINAGNGRSAVIEEYTKYMNNDDVHLYTDSLQDGYIEFRVIQVGAHDGDGSNLTFHTTHFLENASFFDKSLSVGTNTNGWGNSVIRSRLEKYGDVIGGDLNAEFIDAIKSTTKTYRTGTGTYTETTKKESTSGTAAYKTCSDKLFLLSYSEVFGSGTGTYYENAPGGSSDSLKKSNNSAEGSTYTYFKNKSVLRDGSSNACLKYRTRSNSECAITDRDPGTNYGIHSKCWWLRSPNVTNSGFLLVNSNGALGGGVLTSISGSRLAGIAPAFCF